MRAISVALPFLCSLLIIWSGGWRLMGHAEAAILDTEYPKKPIRLIVPTSASGGTDIVARMFGQKISDLSGQSVVIDNRAGAIGMIGMELTANASPDGYVVDVISISHWITASISRHLNFDPIKDFAPVSLLAVMPLVLVIHPSLNVRTMQQFIAMAKNQPGKLNYASGGAGGLPHLATELFKREAKLDLVHVPYKGTGPGLIDLLAGHVQLSITALPAVLQYVKAGKLTAIAVLGKSRSSAAPELPTFTELGLPGVAADVWFGMLAPARTPPAIVHKLSQTIATIAGMSDFREKMLAQGVDPAGSTPAEFGSFLKNESEKWRRVVRDVDIRID